MYAGLSEPQVCCDPLGSDKALTLEQKQQVEVLAKAKVFDKATLPSGVRAHRFLNKPSRVCSLDCRAAGLLPALTVVTGCQDLPGFTCQTWDLRAWLLSPLWYVRQQWGSATGDTSRATAVQIKLSCITKDISGTVRRQILATHCVFQDHSCALDSDFLLLRSRWGHALAVGRDVAVRNSYRK